MKNQAKIQKTEAEWRSQLDPLSYAVLREKGTERPYTGEYNDWWEAGTFSCKGCGNALFLTDAKFDAGCGWPSFFQTLGDQAVIYIDDHSHGMKRVEVQCANCHSHLGHVFDDGPKPTGKRYCMNSVALVFRPI